MNINIIEYFENTVINNPNKIAVIDCQQKITFEKLCIKAKTLAVELSRLNCINKPIAVYLPKSIDSIIADIAITFSGNVYMNLDLKTPSTRIGNVLALIRPVAIITNRTLANFLNEIDENFLLIIIDDFDLDQLINFDVIDNRLKSVIDTDPFCIINTSGSTGTPKGVVLNHKSFIDFTEWAIKTLKITDNETIGSLSPLVFDIYSFELCMLMAKGSTIVLLPDSLAPFPAKILSYGEYCQYGFIKENSTA